MCVEKMTDMPLAHNNKAAVYAIVAFSTYTYTCYRGLKSVPLKFKRLLIVQSVHEVKLILSSCFFLANLTSKAKIIRKLVAFAIF